MNIQLHTTHKFPEHDAFRAAMPCPTPDLTAETRAMLAALSADTDGRKRNGTVRAVVVRHVPVKA